jgi:hypothetical protein
VRAAGTLLVSALFVALAGCPAAPPAASIGPGPSATSAVPSLVSAAGQPSPEPASLLAPDIRPGIQLLLADGRDCTAGFAFREQGGPRAFLATAAHCFYGGTPEQPATCASPQPALAGDRANVTAVLPGGDQPIGRFVYDSFASARPGLDAYACYYRDFALIEVDPALVPRMTGALLADNGTAVPLGAGVPVPGARIAVVSALDDPRLPVLKEGRIVVRATDPQAARAAFAVAAVASDCQHGDSGAPVVDARGDAVGLVLTQPAPGLCGIGPLRPLVADAEATLGIHLELWTASAATPRPA